MNSQVEIVCPQRGTIHQTVDTANPGTLSDLGKAIGGVFAQSAAQWYCHDTGTPVPVNSNTTARVGSKYSASANVKAGR